MRLDKYLGLQNIGTRKQIKEYVKNGRCSVNGTIVSKTDIHVDENKDEIYFDGVLLSYSKFHYYMLYKPQGVVSATTDGKNQTVVDLLSEENVRGLSPAGRLDIDTEGLVLMTDDGGLIHRLLSPRKHVDKVYDLKLMNGTGEHTFAPNANVNRAMAATVLYRIAGEPEIEGESPFGDVPAGKYFTNAVI